MTSILQYHQYYYWERGTSDARVIVVVGTHRGTNVKNKFHELCKETDSTIS